MNRKAFIIIIENSSVDNAKLGTLVEALKKDKDVKAWWYHLSNTMMMITNTNVTAASIQKYITNYLPGIHFLVMQIKAPQDYDGWLPQNAWDWISNSLSNT